MEEKYNVTVNEKPPRDYHWLKIHLLQYGISLFICGLLFLLVLYLRDFWLDTTEMSPRELKEFDVKRLNAIADGFTVPGFIFLCLGLITFVSNRNFFKGVKFAMVKLAAFMMPFSQRLQDKKYSDMQDAKKVSNYSFLFIIGVTLLLVSLIFILANHLY